MGTTGANIGKYRKSGFLRISENKSAGFHLIPVFVKWLPDLRRSGSVIGQIRRNPVAGFAENPFQMHADGGPPVRKSGYIRQEYFPNSHHIRLYPARQEHESGIIRQDYFPNSHHIRLNPARVFSKFPSHPVKSGTSRA